MQSKRRSSRFSVPVVPYVPAVPIVPAVPGAANRQIGLVLAGVMSFAWGCFDPGLSREHWEHREHREPVNIVSRSDSAAKARLLGLMDSRGQCPRIYSRDS
jgi:hypothetical protein